MALYTVVLVLASDWLSCLPRVLIYEYNSTETFHSMYHSAFLHIRQAVNLGIIDEDFTATHSTLYLNHSLKRFVKKY